MSGLSLHTGIRVGGSYTPMTPPASTSPSGAGMTIGQQAYGISGTGGTKAAMMPAAGSVGLGIFATVALVYLWWSLPR